MQLIWPDRGRRRASVMTNRYPVSLACVAVLLVFGGCIPVLLLTRKVIPSVTDADHIGIQDQFIDYIELYSSSNDEDDDDSLYEVGDMAAEPGGTRDSCLDEEEISQCSDIKVARLPPDLRREGWRATDVLGSGGFGMVFKLENTVTQEFAALKAAVPSKLKRKDNKKAWKSAAKNIGREAEVLEGLASQESRHLCRLHRTGRMKIESSGWRNDSNAFSKHVAFIVIDFFNWYDFRTLVLNEQLSPDETDILLWQVAMGLRDIHKAGYVHADIKPANIFVSRSSDKKELKVALCDYGLVRKLPDLMMKVTKQSKVRCSGTKKYMAPEVTSCCNDKQYANNSEYCDLYDEDGTQLDLWSLGVVMNWAHTGTRPCRIKGLCGKFKDYLPHAAYVKVAEDAKALAAGARGNNVRDIISKLLVVNPDTRLTATGLEEAMGDYLFDKFEDLEQLDKERFLLARMDRMRYLNRLES